MSTAALLATLHVRGVRIRAEGGALALRPADAPTDDLLAQVRDHKAELLELLNGAESPPAGRAPDRPVIHAEPPPIVNTGQPRVADPPGDDDPLNPPLVRAAMSAFPEAEVVSVQPEPMATGPQPDGSYIAANPARQAVIDLLWPIERTDPERARDLRDAWRERMAICTIDGGLSEAQAEQVALDELRGMIDVGGAAKGTFSGGTPSEAWSEVAGQSNTVS